MAGLLLPPALSITCPGLQVGPWPALCLGATCGAHCCHVLLALCCWPAQAGLEQLPTHLSQVLDQHTDEVWALQFSHDGRHLASASKDGSVILWWVGRG